MQRALALLAVPAAILAGSWSPAPAGHEVGFYPSYYPHEIRIDTVEPGRAATRLGDKTLHAYIGAIPGGAELAGHVKPIDSLGAFLVLDFNPDAEAFRDAASRCAAARGVLAALREARRDFVLHPYPVTPYHADYLHHLDLIEAAEAAIGHGPAPRLNVRAEGRLAETAAGAGLERGSDRWDLSLEEVSVRDLAGDAALQINGWLGPPWGKEGWFQAYRLLAPALADDAERRAAEAIFGDLTRGAYVSRAERLDLERRLLAALTRGCRRVVAGYMVRREYYNDDATVGAENIAFDSQAGLDSPVFVRTVKLKDFPWNGWLNLGTEAAFAAAWNPVGGFTDAPGRLIWSALGDPALLPVPYNASWIPNRVEFTLDRSSGQSGGFVVPPESLRPEPGAGLLRQVRDPVFASARLTYEVTASPFLDGTETTTADLLYAYAFAYRWAAQAGPEDQAFDPAIAAATEAMRARLVGIRPLRVDTAVNRIAPDVEIVQSIPVLEVYLTDTPGDPQQVAALAPPWSTVPWHLLVLMEELVLRGDAAFTADEAKRRGAAWLDLARDPAMIERMRALIGEFEAAAHRPAALRALVTEDEARARWRALREFAAANGHLLVTNGPYRLARWQPGAVVLAAVREATYPLGFGTFDSYVRPLRALVREIARDADTVTVRVDAEKIAKVGRETAVEVAPLSRTTARGTVGALIASEYLLVGPDGRVAAADKMDWQGDDRFRVVLPSGLPPGRYAVMVAVYLDGNALAPSTGLLRFEVPD